MDDIFGTIKNLLEGTAGILTSVLVIWKVFGPKIKGWIKSIAEEIIEKPIADIEKRFKGDLHDIQKELILISEHNEAQQKTDLIVLGYTILKDCKSIKKGDRMDEMKYSQLCAMYSKYVELGGNGVVHLAWERFLEDVEVI